jgi:peptide/nickel transport system permease protein
VAVLLCGIGLLPWLSRTDPALTVLKGRSTEVDPSPETLAAIRDELGLDAGPLRLLAQWLSGLAHGDAGRSWISGAEVMPSVVNGLGVSLLLMAAALVVAVGTAGAVCAGTLRLGSRHQLAGRASGGSGAAILAALPEFLIASVLATVIGVQLGWLPAVGWYGPAWMILPALALGLPAGALLGRMLNDLLPAAFAEPWALAASARGLSSRNIARQALRLTVPGLLPHLGLFVVGAGVSAQLGARLLLGPALRAGALHSLHRPVPPATQRLPLLYGAVLLAVIVAGLMRDPLTVDTAVRLRAPTWAHPFGTDALGRDVLARVGHGALTTLLVALAVSVVALVTGVLLGLLPRISGALVDTVNAIPPVLAGLLVAGIAGSGPLTPALAVAVVAWSPLATHTCALLRRERATTHVAATQALGAEPWYVLSRHVLPAVVPPVVRHALIRVPSIALALAALSFLGLGAQPPSPEWGLLLAENQPYAERAPWAVLAPAAVLALLGALAVTAAGGVRWRRLPASTPPVVTDKEPAWRR